MTTEIQSAIEHKGDLSQAVLKQKARAIIYCRVSTEKQEMDGESLDYQEEKCRQYADLHDYEVILVLKEAKSGFIHYSLRKMLTLARQMVKDGLADLIIVFDLRRFSRNFVHSAMIFEEIEQAGGDIISVSENIDNSLTGKLIRSILAWSAESERHKIVEYANRHWQTRLEQGLPVATGRAPYGWGWGDKEKTYYVIVPEEMAVRQSIFYMFVMLDISLRAIAHKLTEDGISTPARARGVKCKKEENAWQPSTVQMFIKDKKNIEVLEICKSTKTLTPKGRETRRSNPNMKTIVNSVLADGTKRLPSAVDVNLYERAQRKLQTNKSEKSHEPKNPKDFLIKGHVHCKTCGHKMHGRYQTSKGRPYPYYCCTNFRNKYSGCPDLTTITTRDIDQLVWEDCCRIFERIDQIQETIERKISTMLEDMLEDTRGKTLMVELEQEIKGAEEEKKKHTEGSYYHKLITKDIQEKREQLQRYREENVSSKLITNQLDTYRKKISSFLDFINTMKGKYESATFQEKRNALDVLGVRVSIYPVLEKTPTLIQVETTQEWLSIPEASKLTGISQGSFNYRIQRGELAVHKRNRPLTAIHRDELARYLKIKRPHVNLEQYEDECFTLSRMVALKIVNYYPIRHSIRLGEVQTQTVDVPQLCIHRDELNRFLRESPVRPKRTFEDAQRRIEVIYTPIFTGVQQSFG